MNIQVAPQLPWSNTNRRMALRGRLVVQMRPGERSGRIAPHAAVSLGLALPSNRVDGGDLDRIVARFSPRMRVTGAFDSAAAHWDDVERSLGLASTLRVEVDPFAHVDHLADALRQLDSVQSASVHYLCQSPFSNEEAPTFGADPREVVGADRALVMEPGDRALIVGVVDSGVALDHPEFEGRLRPGADLVDMPSALLSSKIELFGDTRGRDVSAIDEVGHGTSCASLIGAVGRSMGKGVGGACRILPIRALTGARISGRKTPTALGAIADIDAAVKRAVDLGARVLNLSFGTPESALAEGDPIPHAAVVAYALQRGCVLVAASGNAGGVSRYFPAALPGVIAVGSVDPDGAVSSFTTRGEHVDVCAPGRGVRAAALEGYRRVTGTSFAAPFVAGACALLMARASRRSAVLRPADARRLLVDSARPFASADPGLAGAGVLHIPSALNALDALIQSSGELNLHHRTGRPNS